MKQWLPVRRMSPIEDFTGRNSLRNYNVYTKCYKSVVVNKYVRRLTRYPFSNRFFRTMAQQGTRKRNFWRHILKEEYCKQNLLLIIEHWWTITSNRINPIVLCEARAKHQGERKFYHTIMTSEHDYNSNILHSFVKKINDSTGDYKASELIWVVYRCPDSE